MDTNSRKYLKCVAGVSQMYLKCLVNVSQVCRRCISSVPQAECKSIAGRYSGMRSSEHMFSNLIPLSHMIEYKFFRTQIPSLSSDNVENGSGKLLPTILHENIVVQIISRVSSNIYTNTLSRINWKQVNPRFNHGEILYPCTTSMVSSHLL